MIQLSQVHKIYPNGTHALQGIDLTIKQGEFVVIIGLSGSGKSTLMRCINRLIEPTAGSIQFNGIEVTELQGKELRSYRQQIGMVFQQFNIIKRYSVLKNVLAGSLGRTTVLNSLLNSFAPETVQEAMNCLEIVGIADKALERADSLSGGQQQRVAIARSLMQKPQLILADEPVASLDPATSNAVMQYFEKINKEFGVTILCNLHFLSLVRRYASRVIALKQGIIVFEGLPSEINEVWFKQIYGDEAEEVEIR